jgi:endonuclease III
MPSSIHAEFIEKIKEEKPFDYIVQNLENTFGEPHMSRKSDLLVMLINIILSQATSDANSRRTFQNLKARFKNWDAVLAASEDEIADAIRLGGLANQKAKVIKDLLQQIKDSRGKLSLKFLEKMPDEDAHDFLLQF